MFYLGNLSRRSYRVQLLTTVSAFSLACTASGFNRAEASEYGDINPPVWIELGGQIEATGSGQELFRPHFIDSIPAGGFTSPLKFENAQPWSYGAEGKVTFETDKGWVFSAAVRYGRSLGRKNLHEQTTPRSFYLNAINPHVHANYEKFNDIKVESSNSHAIVDFQVGKDVGLGLFGSHSHSTFSAGIRYAQLNSRSKINLAADPDFYQGSKYITFLHLSFPTRSARHTYAASAFAERSFHGLGPAISWDGSAVLSGNDEHEALTFDWGLSAAILFGKQRATIQHQTSATYHKNVGFNYYPTVHTSASANHSRKKSVTVPNFGAMGGLSLRFTNAKLSVGYRADYFFAASDVGIDSAKAGTNHFSGPFATISIGLGG